MEAKESANEAIQDANVIISDAYNSTVTSVTATGETLIIALLSAKEQVQGMLPSSFLKSRKMIINYFLY